jgi:ABC-2 type transport system ATP-binding protein
MNTNDNLLIDAQHLTKMFKNATVIDDLSIAFGGGERISLSGPNGAGKTTLMRCILGQYLYQGELSVLGKNPRKHHLEIMKNVGFVPQLAPPLKMTIQELIKFFVQLTDRHSEDFTRIAEEMGLELKSNLRKPFYKLSGGMKQKLLIAFALGREPRILLMDEPASNLDPAARMIFFDYLQKYNPQALMILCSHRMNEIAGIINRNIEMDLGRVVLDQKINQSSN